MIRELCSKYGYPEPIIDCEDINVIRNLQKCVLVVTEDKTINLRGVDYRSELGIDLLLAHSLPNERLVLQACGRVGRFSDNAKRWKLKSVQPVDQSKQEQAEGNLLSFKQDLEDQAKLLRCSMPSKRKKTTHLTMTVKKSDNTNQVNKK